METDKTVIFKIGRGGSFNTPGNVICKDIKDSFDAEYYGVNVFFGFENETEEFKDLIVEEEIDGIDIPFLPFIDYKDFLKKFFDFDADVLGEPVVKGENGKVLCTIEEYESDEGILNIDNEYESYYWKPISELTEKEIELMVKTIPEFKFKNLLIENGVDENVLEFILKNKEKIDGYSTYLFEKTSFEEFDKIEDLLCFETEEEAENEGCWDVIEINNKFYTL